MSFDIQRQIRHNAEEIKNYVSDLYDWEQAMDLKAQAKSRIKREEPTITLPIRKVESVEPTKPVIKDLLRDKNTVGDYYKAWDKFNIDKQIQRLEEQQTRPYRPYNPYEDSKNNLRAKPKARMTVTGRRSVVVDPNSLKEKGNLHFQSCEFDKAIECYSECLDKIKQQPTPQRPEDRNKLLAVVYANRAMAQLKNNETLKALEDCNESIKCNPNYAKSYFRRGECLRKLGKFRDSLADYRKVRELEPQDAKAGQELQKVELFLAKRCKEAREALVVSYSPELFRRGERIEIQECDELTPHELVPNYLNEL